jgi:nitroreductase
LVTEKQEIDFIFGQLSWAKHLSNWSGPAIDERPPAYIVMLLDTRINPEAGIDAGISAQTILLGAAEKNLGGCIIRTVNRNEITHYFKLPGHFEILLVIAIGKPKQQVRLVEVNEGKTEYFTDGEGVHCVPKRALEDVIFRHEPD